MLGSAEVFLGKSAGVKDSPRGPPVGSVGRGEGVTSEAEEDADGRYPAETGTVLVGVTSEKEGKTDVWSFAALISPEGVGVEKREGSVKTAEVGTAVQSDMK